MICTPLQESRHDKKACVSKEANHLCETNVAVQPDNCVLHTPAACDMSRCVGRHMCVWGGEHRCANCIASEGFVSRTRRVFDICRTQIVHMLLCNLRNFVLHSSNECDMSLCVCVCNTCVCGETPCVSIA